MEAGFVDASALFIDGTHIKANANKHRSSRITVTKPIKQYQSELDEEVSTGRKSHGKKELSQNGEKQENVENTVSTTDPDSGLFVKG